MMGVIAMRIMVRMIRGTTVMSQPADADHGDDDNDHDDDDDDDDDDDKEENDDYR